ncbi:MAG: aspartate kinase [Coriobacteriia bacterium]|nr:aspartate kinase [Coriobacteriia bacterium]
MSALPASVVVQKFGGTSVATAEGRDALRARVSDTRATGDAVVVIVSAMGRSGAPYATDTLLSLLDGHDVVPREADMLAACGEVISAVVVAHELRSAGVPAIALTGAEAGVITDGVFRDAAVLDVDTTAISAALADGLVPVITGFQGVTASGETTTLGRGGSDTSACAIAAALGASAVEIYTDVDGVMTADPRACDAVRVLDALQYEELFQMAKAGSKVMHAPAAEAAMAAGVPVWVRNTYSPARGTIIADAARIAAESRPRVATAVSHVDGIARIMVRMSHENDPGARMRAITRVFRSMADAGVSLDMFTPCGTVLVLSFADGLLADAIRVLDAIGLPYDVEIGLAKVTLVGAGMHGVPGVMARVAEALAGAGVDILQIADSHYTISVLVRQEVRRTTIGALHEAFELGS